MDGPEPVGASGFQLRFASLCVQRRALFFACDKNGSVGLEYLSPRAKDIYPFARGMVGRYHSRPVVRAAHASH